MLLQIFECESTSDVPLDESEQAAADTHLRYFADGKATHLPLCGWLQGGIKLTNQTGEMSCAACSAELLRAGEKNRFAPAAFQRWRGRA